LTHSDERRVMPWVRAVAVRVLRIQGWCQNGRHVMPKNEAPEGVM
jgi:hypothetical protein